MDLVPCSTDEVLLKTASPCVNVRTAKVSLMASDGVILLANVDNIIFMTSKSREH